MRLPGGDVTHSGAGTVQPPVDLHLARAARRIQAHRASRDVDPGGATAFYAALDIWEALTGLSGEAALTYADEVAPTDQRATLLPF